MLTAAGLAAWDAGFLILPPVSNDLYPHVSKSWTQTDTVFPADRITTTGYNDSGKPWFNGKSRNWKENFNVFNITHTIICRTEEFVCLKSVQLMIGWKTTLSRSFKFSSPHAAGNRWSARVRKPIGPIGWAIECAMRVGHPCNRGTRRKIGHFALQPAKPN